MMRSTQQPADWPAIGAQRRQFERQLMSWFRRTARDLPWRRTRDPYAIWLSEVMLQQTQVATVERYFRRFVEQLPTIHALATAPEEQVLRLWEGLGYYRRARQLHAAARQIVALHAGEFPRALELVRALPGVGRYTAGAILSIAFDARQPILEANTQRLFARLLNYRQDVTQAAGQRRLWEFAEAVLPTRQTGLFNQALMELGSQVCVPREPRCDDCPVVMFCAARRQGDPQTLPVLRQRAATQARHEVALLVEQAGKVLLLRRDGTGRWAGLWDFPRLDVTDRSNWQHELHTLSAAQLETTALAEVELGEQLTRLDHAVTRYRIRLDAFLARPRPLRRTTRPRAAQAQASDTMPSGGTLWQWFEPEQLASLPLNTTGRKLAKLWIAHTRATAAQQSPQAASRLASRKSSSREGRGDSGKRRAAKAQASAKKNRTAEAAR